MSSELYQVDRSVGFASCKIGIQTGKENAQPDFASMQHSMFLDFLGGGNRLANYLQTVWHQRLRFSAIP